MANGAGLINGANLVGGLINRGRDTEDYISSMFDAHARRKAGQLAAEGDREGARRILEARGMPEAAAAMLTTQDDERRREALGALAGGDAERARVAAAAAGDTATYNLIDRTTEHREALHKAEIADQNEFMLNGAEALRQIPAEQRMEAFQHLKPALVEIYKSRGLDPSGIDALEADGLSDDEIDSVIVALGGELEKDQYFNTSRGIAWVNPKTKKPELVLPIDDEVDPNADLEREKLEAEVEAIRALREQRVASAKKAARPPAGRSGGGGIPPLPPGFVMEK